MKTKFDHLCIFQGMNPFLTATRKSEIQPKSSLVGVGFGCLLFILQWVFGDLSVVSRWASNGYPNQAPEPIPYGSVDPFTKIERMTNV